MEPALSVNGRDAASGVVLVTTPDLVCVCVCVCVFARVRCLLTWVVVAWVPVYNEGHCPP